VFKNENIDAEALFQEFIQQGVSPQEAQKQTEETIHHLHKLKEQHATPKENSEKRKEIREKGIRELEKMVQLEALGVVFDTIGIYLKSSPKTENFKLEDIRNIEIKNGSLIISGEINGVPISF
jgi:repressor of nif and glnA expression